MADKECPFCGKSETVAMVEEGDQFQGYCCGCSASGPCAETIESAELAWNKRAALASATPSTKVDRVVTVPYDDAARILQVAYTEGTNGHGYNEAANQLYEAAMYSTPSAAVGEVVPVAWRYKEPQWVNWFYTNIRDVAYGEGTEGFVVEPLYSATPTKPGHMVDESPSEAVMRVKQACEAADKESYDQGYSDGASIGKIPEKLKLTGMTGLDDYRRGWNACREAMLNTTQAEES